MRAQGALPNHAYFEKSMQDTYASKLKGSAATEKAVGNCVRQRGGESKPDIPELRPSRQERVTILLLVVIKIEYILRGFELQTGKRVVTETNF